MKRVALTGGIATGKSHVLESFASLGVPTLDADLVAREVVEPGRPAAAAIRRRFGSEVFHTDGTVDRPALATVVFDDPTARLDLEAIMHPPIRDRIGRWFTERQRDRTPFAIVAIPLLFETGRQDEFDPIIVTACTSARQRHRLCARGLSEGEADRHLAAQLPSARKEAGADYIIRTDDTHAETDRQVRDVYDALTRLGNG